MRHHKPRLAPIFETQTRLHLGRDTTLDTQDNDPHQLSRFIQAQEADYQSAHVELASGRKVGHWIWYIFPQPAGLGSSSTSRRYAIGSKDEAREYVAHPILGARLQELTRVVLSLPEQPIEQIFGNLDAMKFRSSMTLFSQITEAANPFRDVINKFYNGELDPLTMRWLEDSD